jgi:hypothetical protein
MDAAVQMIIERGWSIDPSQRPSFDQIFSVLEAIEFRLSRGVDSARVYEFISLVGSGSEASGADILWEKRLAKAAEREPSKFLLKDWEFPVSKVTRGGRFPWLVKKGDPFDVPDGIIAHLTRQCGGNVHDCYVVNVTCGSFEKETQGGNPRSGAANNDPKFAAENAADLQAASLFLSTYRKKEDRVPHTRNNWLCYDFKGRRIVPTHYAIRTYGDSPGGEHLKSWLVETSADGKSWYEVAREKDNDRLNGKSLTGTFAVAGVAGCRLIRLVNIGRNHFGTDCLCISAWEIFGRLIE